MVNFKYDKNQFLEYIARIENNLPQMIVCSISEVIFDYDVAKKFNNAAKKNKHIYQLCISNAIFKKGTLFKKCSINFVLDGILSMGFDYISLNNCQLKDCLDTDTIRYLSNEKINSISMSKSVLSTSDVNIIAKAILSNKKITSVNLSDCSMNDVGLKFLSNAISKHKYLKNINVSSSSSAQYAFLGKSENISNNFSQKAIDYFFHIMKNQETITSLNFSYNKIANIGSLVEFVKINNVIVDLKLSGCGISKTDDLFCAMKNQNSIKSLNFAGNNLTDVDKLVELLQINTNIIELDLCCCNIRNVDINRILQVLISNNTIVYLELDGNDKFNDACGKTLIEVLKKNRTLKYLGLATHNDILSEICIEEILLEMEKREDLELNLHPHIDGHYRG
jgi:hypothetical protein